MWRTRNTLLLLAAVLTAALVGCSKKGGSKDDPVVGVEKDDPDMKAAIGKARTSLPQFWTTFENRTRGEGDFALKVRITDKNGTEYFWAINLDRRDGRIYGTINNNPETVRSVKLGQRIEIPDADISDWLYMRDGKMVGNYTLRAVFKSMPADEVAKLKQRLAEP